MYPLSLISQVPMEDWQLEMCSFKEDVPLFSHDPAKSFCCLQSIIIIMIMSFATHRAKVTLSGEYDEKHL